MARDKTKERRRVSKEDVRNNARESGGGKKYFNLPQGVELWEPTKAGSYVLDFFPYVIKTEKHPDRKGNKMIPGDIWYKYPYQTHRNIGPSNEEVVCPASFGEPCPVCEERARLAKNYNENKAEIKAINAKRNAAYIIRNPEDADRYAVFAYSVYKFGEKLDEELKNDESTLNFYDVTEEGRQVTVRFSDDEYKGDDGSSGKFLMATRIDFKPRGVFDEDEVLDNVPCLDEIFHVLPYEDLEKLFLQVGGDDKNESKSDSAPTTARQRTPSGSGSGKSGTAPTGSAPSGGRPSSKNKAPGKAAATATPPPAAEEPKVKDGDRVSFTDPDDAKKKLFGVVEDVDGDDVSIKGEDGDDYTVDIDDVELAPATEEKKAKGGKKAAAPQAPTEPPEIKIGSTVKDDEDNVGVVTAVSTTEVKFVNADGKKIKADIDDVTLVEPEDKEEEGDDGEDDEDDGKPKVGSKVTFQWKGKTVTGTIKKIEENDDCVIKGDDGKTHTLDIDDLTPVDGEGESEEGDGEDGPHEWAVGDKVTWDDGDEEGRIVKLHSTGTKVRVGTQKGEVWVPVDDDLKFVPADDD